MQRRGWKRPSLADLKCIQLERKLKQKWRQQSAQKGASDENNTHTEQEAHRKSQ